MAKVINFTDNNKTIDITPKTKSTTYKYTGEGVFTFTINTGAGAYDYYQNFGSRNNDDLIITTVYIKDKSGAKKTLTTTIKDYFANDEACKVIFKTQEIYGVDKSYTITPITVEDTNGLYQVMTEDTTGNDYISGTKKNDEIHLVNGGADYLYDPKGSDFYIIKKGGIFANEFGGNDVYRVWDTAVLIACEHKGNDDYKTDGSAMLQVEEFSGNDYYRTEKGTNSWMAINDYSGKDEYLLYSSAASTVADYKGNDKYDIMNKIASEYSKNNITDYEGKDTYEVKNALGLSIDDKKGNDKYKVQDCEDIDTTHTNTNISVHDESGNDNYTYTNVVYSEYHQGVYGIIDDNGKDKYIFNQVRNLNIKDLAGSDTYNFTDTASADLVDEKGNDKYTIVGGDSDFIDIYDSLGKDKYTLTGTQDDKIYMGSVTDDGGQADSYKLTYVYEFEIKDNGKSKDSYSFKYSDAVVTDEGGNDSYKISGFVPEHGDSIKIDDKGGKDKLTLSGFNKKDVIVMCNFNQDGGCEDNALILYDKSSQGYVYINDFYKDEDSDKQFDGFGDGKIESIKVGKTSLKTSAVSTYEHFDAVRESVATWLTDNSHSNVEYAITSCNPQELESLIAYFTGN